MTESHSLPEPLIERLRGVRSVGAITGAGISVESGLQTYRGKGGVYDDPEEGDKRIEAVSGPTLQSDPDRTWRAISSTLLQAAQARPNDGHHALVAIEKKMDRFVLLTQNVDGLHQLAGSKNIIDIHGHVFDIKCMSCGTGKRLERNEVEPFERAPRCEECDGVMRPDVVLFEEMLPMEKVARIRMEFARTPPELVMAIGTTALFPYIVEPVVIASQTGMLAVEINPEPTMLSSHVDFCLRGPAGAYLPLIEKELGDGISR
jgi:NAD-dependent deacetylase